LRRWFALALMIAWTAGAQTASRPARRVILPPAEKGKPLYELHCSQCHGDRGLGDGPAAVYLYPKPRDFTRGLFKIRTTPSGSLPTDQDLYDTIGRGMPGSAMPGFSQLTPQDRWALVSYLKTLVEAYQYRAPEPAVRVGIAPPKTAATLALGKEMYRKMECFKCHGEAGEGDGPSAAELKDDWGIPIQVRDFTDGTYKGGPADRDLYLRFTTGMTGSPMPAYSGDKMTAADRWALVQFVQSLRRPDRTPIVPPANGVVTAAHVSGALPAEAMDARWKQAAGADLPMNPLWQRKQSVSHVTLRALHNSNEIAFLLEWPDSRPGAASGRTEEFGDAVALQFGLRGEKAQTFLGMGHQLGATNIWHWKSDWQAQLAATALPYPATHSDHYPFGQGFLSGRMANNAFSAATRLSPVENLAAIGFGTLTPQPEQLVQGHGVWSDGKWHVVLRRDTMGTGKNEVTFAPGAAVPFAVATWDGAQGDRNGRKMVTYWYLLKLESKPATRAAGAGPQGKR
jgi:DMSO reductase family type II enzyme heme b subunit